MSNMKSIKELMWREEDQDPNRDKIWDPPAIKVSERNQDMDEMYNQYISLGGKLSIDDYYIVNAHFIHFTLTAYVSGYVGHYGDRRNSMLVFQMWLDENYPGERAGIIFDSVDRVHAYT